MLKGGRYIKYKYNLIYWVQINNIDHFISVQKFHIFKALNQEKGTEAVVIFLGNISEKLNTEKSKLFADKLYCIIEN